MRRAWDGWRITSLLPFIKCGHGSIMGETVECCKAREAAQLLLSLQSTPGTALLQTNCMWGLVEKRQACQTAMLNETFQQSCYGCGSDGERSSSTKWWTAKCFTLFCWSTGWCCRRLEPSMEWNENGLKGHVEMLNWPYQFTVAFSDNWRNDASCWYWNRGDTSNTCKNTCAMENVVINENKIKIQF